MKVSGKHINKSSAKSEAKLLEYDKKQETLHHIALSRSETSDEEISFSTDPDPSPDEETQRLLGNPDLGLIGQIMCDLNSHPVVVLGKDKLPEGPVISYMRKMKRPRT